MRRTIPDTSTALQPSHCQLVDIVNAFSRDGFISHRVPGEDVLEIGLVLAS